MGSTTDWSVMQEAAQILDQFAIPYETRVLSAHRTPELTIEFAKNARKRGIEVIIAGAGGAAHLPGVVASLTILPVIGVPIPSLHLNGYDSLLSIVQMPAGVPVATVGIGNARNAALLAIQILSATHPELTGKLEQYRKELAEKVRSAKIGSS